MTYVDQCLDRRCVHCETRITASDWYPAATERTDDGELALRYFCSEACRREWETED